MTKLLLKLSILIFSIQLTAQTSTGIVSGMGKWVPIKTEFYSNDKLVNSEEFKMNEKCIPYIEFMEGGVVINKDYYSDCGEKKSKPGTYKYIGDGFYKVSQEGEAYNFKTKIIDDELQMITYGKDEDDGTPLKVVVLLKRYDSFNNDKGKEVIIYHDNGQVKSKILYKDGKKNGAGIYYDKKGQITGEYSYTNGMKNGFHKRYYRDYGTLFETGNYSEDKRNGEWKAYYETGELKSIGKYIDGTREGEWKIISEDYSEYPGDVYEIGFYNKSRRVGEWKKYSYGKLSSSGPYLNGKKNGVWKIYFLSYSNDKDVSATGNYLNGKREGEWKVYHGEGILKSTGYYQNDKKIGVWKFYDKEGNLTKSENH